MSNEKSPMFSAALALGVALVLASFVISWGLVRLKGRDQTITVTGSARKRIRSDLVIWRVGVSYQATQMAVAYKSPSESVPRVKAYLITAVVNVSFAVD